MSHANPRIPVYNYKQNYASNPITPGTPYAITSPGLQVLQLDITDTSGQNIDFLIGNTPNQHTAFTIPQGGGTFRVILNPGMSLYLNALTPTQSQTTVNQGNIVINGYQ
jgi:hypothetical protein